MASPEYQIVELTAADFDEWSAVFHAYIEFYKSTLEEEQYRRTFDRIIEKREGLQCFVVKEVNGESSRIAGLAHFYPQQTTWGEKKILFLNDLFVESALRGKGLGRRLIEAVTDVAKKDGRSCVQWLTQHENHTAQRLYNKVAESAFKEYRIKLE